MAGRCDTNDGHGGCPAAASVEGQCRQERAAARCRRDGWQRGDAHKFLATTHDSRDYVRLMLYWHLGRRGKVDVAKAYLDERWRGIDKDSWPARLAQGDTQVWRERLIGYYLGNVTPEEFFQPLRSREAFEASGLNRIGLSYDEIRCEAYFYDALLQAVTGDAATRSARFAKGIQEVLETRAGHYYEHLVARYLRSRGNRQGG